MRVDYSTFLIIGFVISRLGVDYHMVKDKLFHALDKMVYYSTYGGRLFYDHEKGFIILCRGVDYSTILEKEFFIVRTRVDYYTAKHRQIINPCT